MSLIVEQTYREHVAGSPPLAETLEILVPADPDGDDGPTRLVRQLCFEPGWIDDTVCLPFAEVRTDMLDHGLRQAALMRAVFDKVVKPPVWLPRHRLGQAALVADVGVSFIPDEEYKWVYEFGPKYARHYNQHPELGYRMAESAGLHDDESRLIALFIAWHHQVQARYPYGPDWTELNWSGASRERVDLMVMIEKAFDYMDDVITRRHAEITDLAQQVQAPHLKFAHSLTELIGGNLSLVGAIMKSGLDPTLPHRISEGIMKVILDPESPMGKVYHDLRPDLLPDAPKDDVSK